MKEGIHPNYGYVVFRDEAADFQFITRSTAKSKKKITVDGQEYPLVTLDISSASHPFYTGRQMLVDTAGRIEKFNRRYGKFKQREEADKVAAAKKAEAAKAEEPKAEAAAPEAPAAPAAPAGGENAGGEGSSSESSAGEGGMKLS